MPIKVTIAHRCPYCGMVVMCDDVGMHHERPSCEQWSAKMVALGATVLVVHIDREKDEAN